MWYRWIGGICLLGALVACAEQRDYQYLKSRNGRLVRVPPPLVQQEFSQYYILPNPTGPVEVNITPVIT